MNVYTLKDRHLTAFPGSHFFDSDTLKFFGERLSSMSVRKDTVQVADYSGVNHTCYVLSSLQRKRPGGPGRAYHYFDSITFEHVISK